MPAEAALAAGRVPAAGAYDADIIILTQNRFSETLAAVASARAQQGVRLYVALLDQGCGPEMRAAFQAAFQDFADFGYFVSETNSGVGGGRNRLSAIGHGRIIVGLDNDAVFADAFVVAKTMKLFAANERLGAVGYGILNAAGTGLDENSWGYPAALKREAGKRFPSTTFVGAGHAIRRAAWRETGGYDESLFFTWEEYDFSLRAIARGWRVEYDGGLCVHHALAAEGRVRWTAGRTTLFVRNRLLIARKWGDSWLALAPRILAYIVKGACAGRLRATLVGIAQAIHLAGAARPTAMPQAMRNYILAHEQKHRGSWLRRLRYEVLGTILADPPG